MEQVIEQLKNPLIIGVVVGAVVYLYLRWESKRKHKEDPQAEKRPVNLMIPGAVGAISWFVASAYLNRDNTRKNSAKVSLNEEAVIGASLGGTRDLMSSLPVPVSSPDISSFELLKKRKVRLPATDVFLDIGDF